MGFHNFIEVNMIYQLCNSKKDNGKTEIELLNFSLPGGVVQSVLYSLFNVGSLDAAYETMKSIQKQASLPEYMLETPK